MHECKTYTNTKYENTKTQKCKNTKMQKLKDKWMQKFKNARLHFSEKALGKKLKRKNHENFKQKLLKSSRSLAWLELTQLSLP